MRLNNHGLCCDYHMLKMSRWGHHEFVNHQHCLAKQSCFLNINYSTPPSHQYIMGEGGKRRGRGSQWPDTDCGYIWEAL